MNLLDCRLLMVAQEIVLSQDQDPFFKKNMFLNFGDLGGNIKDYVDHYKAKTNSNRNIESIADMKRFIEEYPEFRRLGGNVDKHVALLGELSRKVDQDNLLEVSELEQSLACNDSHPADLKVRSKMWLPCDGRQSGGKVLIMPDRPFNGCCSRPYQLATKSGWWHCTACGTNALHKTRSPPC